MLIDRVSPANQHGSYMEFRPGGEFTRPSIRSRCPEYDREVATLINLTPEMAYWLIRELQAAFPDRRKGGGDRRVK